MVVLACGDIDSRSVQWNRWGPRRNDRLLPRVPHPWARHFVETINDWDFYHHLGPDNRNSGDLVHHLDTDTRNGENGEDYPELLVDHKGVSVRNARHKSEELQEGDVQITIHDDDDIRSALGDGYWIKKLHLTDVDRAELLNGEMLSDKHILAAQKLLQDQFPHIAGLQDPCLSQTSFQPVERDSVQIHHTRGNHWVLSNWVQGDIVEVYDTLYHNVAPDLLRQLDEIYVNAPRDCRGHVRYAMCDVAKQQGHRDCGLLAVALAFELCQGYDVTDVTFRQRLMRQHLVKCFEQHCIESFPMF